MRINRRNLVFTHHFRLFIGAEHEWDVGTIDIAVEQSYFVTHLSQSDGQIDGKSRLADSALTGTDGDNGIDTRKRLRRGLLLAGMMGMSTHALIIREGRNTQHSALSSQQESSPRY